MEKNIKHQDELLRTVMHRVAEDTERMSLSDDFADRLIQRIKQEEAAKRTRMLHKRIWFSVGIAAVILLLLVMGFWLNGQFNKEPELIAQTDTTKPAPQVEEGQGAKSEGQGAREEEPETKQKPVEKADSVNKVKEMERVPRPPKRYMAKDVEKEIVQPERNVRLDAIVFTEPPYLFLPRNPMEEFLSERFQEREEAIEHDDYSIESINQQQLSKTFEDVERDIRIRGERMNQAMELAMSDDFD